MSECVRRIRAEEGWRGFYRGLGACLCGVAPEKAVKLAVNEKLREHLAARDHDQFVPPSPSTTAFLCARLMPKKYGPNSECTPLTPACPVATNRRRITLAHEILAGAGAGMCQATVSNPAEIGTTRRPPRVGGWLVANVGA